MTVVIKFEDRDYTYDVPFSKIAKKLNITEEQIIDAVREVLKTT